MTTHKWTTPAAIQTALSTELNALANGAYSAASGAIDNLTGLNLYIDLELYLGSLTPTAGGYCAVYLVPTIDGSNYTDGGGATAPPANTLIAAMDLSTSASVKWRSAWNIPIPPYAFKLVLLNAAGAALAATSNTLKYRLHNEGDA